MTKPAGITPDRMVRLPTVQLIGAQKAGTSAIAEWLFDEGGFRRPKVFTGEPSYYSKEVHFFDIDHRYCKGPSFYGQRFESDVDTVPSFRTLDATPDTLQFPDRVNEVYKMAGGGQKESLKIIAILREPIARELSLYNHLAHDCRSLDKSERTSWHNQVLVNPDGDGDNIEVMSFTQFVQKKSIPALRKNERSAISCNDDHGRSTRHSLYADHLAEWFKYFSREQILILSYDELLSDPERLQQRIQSFLLDIAGQIAGNIQFGINSNDNSHKVRVPSPSTVASLQATFRPENEKLYQLLEAYQSGRPLAEQSPFPKFKGFSSVGTGDSHQTSSGETAAAKE